MASDRIFGLVMATVALAYIASATQIQTSFLSDPVGPKTFPILIGIVCAISAMFMVLKPDPEPDWPALRTIGALLFAIIVLVAYAYALKPLGLLLPTAVAAGVLSFQISPKVKTATLSGLACQSGCFFFSNMRWIWALFRFPKVGWGKLWM